MLLSGPGVVIANDDSNVPGERIDIGARKFCETSSDIPKMVQYEDADGSQAQRFTGNLVCNECRPTLCQRARIVGPQGGSQRDRAARHESKWSLPITSTGST